MKKNLDVEIKTAKFGNKDTKIFNLNRRKKKKIT